MIPEDSALAGCLVDGYGPYVRGVVCSRGWDSLDGIDAAIEAGESWLRDSLETLFAAPFPEQRSGPLELFQEAMRFPSDVLASAGLPVPPRDETAVKALPGDIYDLAPVSSRLLGEDVWHAHLAWGAAKARAMTSNRVS